MARIHVIVPVYNAKKYLREAVDSVLNQPYKEIDIVLVNDGSTDGSAELCDEIAAHEVRVTAIHQQNRGVSAARNAAIEHILVQHSQELEQSYIAFLDADDIWVPDAIKPEFVMNNFGDYDMYYFGMLGATQELDRFCIYSSYQDKTVDNPRSLVWDWSGYFVSYLYSCNMLKKYNIRFSTATKYVEDRMFASACLYFAKQVCCCSKYLYIYRYNSGSAMHTKGSVSPIVYYEQIINGWIETDNFINSWQDTTGKQSKMGHTLASIYFLDMAAEHYQNWGSKKQLLQFQKKSSLFTLFENMVQADVSPKQYKEHLLMMHYPVLFKLKHNVCGILVNFKYLLFRCRFVKQLYMRKRYFLSSAPVNK